MGRTCCMWESAAVGSGSLGYRPAGGGEVVITGFITAYVVSGADGR